MKRSRWVVGFVLGMTALACGGSDSTGSTESNNTGGDGGGGGGGGGSGGTCTDTCTLLQPSEIQSVTGLSAGAGIHGDPLPHSSSCRFKLDTKDPKKISEVQVYMTCAPNMISGADALKKVLNGYGYTGYTELNGLGLRAMEVTLGAGGSVYSAVLVHVYPDADHYFYVSVSGPIAEEAQMRKQAETLARDVLARLH